MNISPLLGLLNTQAVIKFHHDMMWGQTNRVPLNQVMSEIDKFLNGDF